jgi:hypothetical protein
MGQTRNKKNCKISWDSDKGNITLQIPWDAAEAIIRGKFLGINTYVKKEERSQINNLTLCFEELEK